MSEPLTHMVTISADADTIYNAVTTSRGLSSFWTAESHAEPRVGSIAVFGFHGTTLQMRVEDLQPSRLVAWSSPGDFPEMGGHWKDTTISWEIVPTGVRRAEVRFRHAGWQDDVPPELLAAVSSTWEQVVGHLKHYAETGSPDPVFP